ncbi:MAG: type 1 fimbrial protein [Metakosakonia sp.]|nr:fimbrial protein [Phytobacter sp.]MBV8872362.1 type 1 fimbrial protein [Phytobacter sp.]
MLSRWRFLFAVTFIFLNMPVSTWAFTFNDEGATAYMNASSVPTSLGNIASQASGTASVRASGNPTSLDQDRVVIDGAYIRSGFSDRGFSLEVKVGNSAWLTPEAAKGKCVWIDGDCKTNYSNDTHFDKAYTVPVSVRVVRNSTENYSTIPSGTQIASIHLKQYSRSQPSGYNMAYLSFYLNGSVTPVVPTCDVKTYDTSVTLPEVRRSDLMRSIWRYQGAYKEFTINIDCKNNVAKANITFNGDKMPGVGSNDALKNMNSGNDNVGVQILFDNTPLVIGKEVFVKWWPGENTPIKFKAHYFTKPGSINPGTVKAKTEFVLTYE